MYHNNNNNYPVIKHDGHLRTRRKYSNDSRTGIWKVMVSTPVGGSENFFSEYFDLGALLHYFHFIQVSNPFIMNSLNSIKFSCQTLDLLNSKRKMYQCLSCDFVS